MAKTAIYHHFSVNHLKIELFIPFEIVHLKVHICNFSFIKATYRHYLNYDENNKMMIIDVI